MAKKQIPQVEIKFGEPEAFALVVEQTQTQDGDRVAREATQREADNKHAEKLQATFA